MEMNTQDAPSAVFKVRDEIVCKEIGDTCVLLDLRSGAFYTLNEMASHFWKLIERQATIEDIAVHIKQLYDVSREQVLQDLAAFIDFFTRERLLIWVSSQRDSMPTQ